MPQFSLLSTFNFFTAEDAEYAERVSGIEILLRREKLSDMKISFANVFRIVFVSALAFWAASGVSAAEEKGSAFEMRRVVSDGESVASETLPWAKRSGERDLKVEKKALLDQRHVENAVVIKNPLTGNDEVKVTLTKEGAELFSKATRENIGKRLAVVSGGKVLIAPVIRTEISGGTLMISGDFSTQEVQEIARLLASKKDSGRQTRRGD